jgi:hypothetical protein
LKTSNSTGTNVNNSSNNTNNNVSSNGHNSATLSSNQGNQLRPKYNTTHQDTISNNLNNAASNSGQYRYQFSNSNYTNEGNGSGTFITRNESGAYQQKYINLNNLNNATNTKVNGSSLTNGNGVHILDSKTKGGRYPIEMFAKKDMNNQQTKLLNSYRIQSAQNLAKQRSTGK